MTLRYYLLGWKESFHRLIKHSKFMHIFRQQTTTTILQNTGHHYPPLFAIGPPGFGSDRSTTPSALNQRTLDMLLQLHRKIQIGDLPKSVALIGKGRNQIEQRPNYRLDAVESQLRPIPQTLPWSFWLCVVLRCLAETKRAFDEQVLGTSRPTCRKLGPAARSKDRR